MLLEASIIALFLGIRVRLVSEAGLRVLFPKKTYAANRQVSDQPEEAAC
jgi:hypothetical protein